MTEIAVPPAAPAAPDVAAWLGASRRCSPPATRRRRVPVRRGLLLARPRRVHLEHQDRRGPRGVGDARRDARPHARRAAGARPSRRPRPSGVTEAWIRSRPRSAAAAGTCGCGRQGLDAAHHAARAQGPRGAGGPAPAEGRRARRRPRPRDLARAPRSARPRSSGTRRSPYVVIVGGGQGGIALGARLRQLGVPTIIVERNERPGDSWRKRYKSLCLHDPVWYDHLPYIKFPENWPVFSPKDKIADWLEMYTRVMELNYWGSTTRQAARSYDEEAGEWTRRRRARRRRRHAAARSSSCWPPACRASRTCPSIPGMDVFRGDQHHSSPAPGPGRVRGQAGRRHRLQQLRARHLRGAVGGRRRRDDGAALVDPHRALRHADGHRRSAPCTPSGRSPPAITTEKADMIFASLPYRILHEFQIPLYDADARARRRLLRPARGARASCSTAARTTPGCS